MALLLKLTKILVKCRKRTAYVLNKISTYGLFGMKEYSVLNKVYAILANYLSKHKYIIITHLLFTNGFLLLRRIKNIALISAIPKNIEVQPQSA